MLPKARGAEAERAVACVGVGGGLAPRRANFCNGFDGQMCEQPSVGVERQRRVGRACIESVEQRARCLWQVAHRIAGLGEIGEQREHARRHVEADRVAGAAGRARIIRQ